MNVKAKALRKKHFVSVGKQSAIIWLHCGAAARRKQALSVQSAGLRDGNMGFAETTVVTGWRFDFTRECRVEYLNCSNELSTTGGVADLGARVFVVYLVQAVFPPGPGTILGELYAGVLWLVRGLCLAKGTKEWQ
jgi:hypothetical protein